MAISTDMNEITAEELVQLNTIPILDIRPTDERYGDMGYIPGSRSLDAEEILASISEFEQRYARDRAVVLVCLSGGRSDQVQEVLRSQGFAKVMNLKGGILAWADAGLPLCGLSIPDEQAVPLVTSREQFVRQVVSCFVAETVESCLDEETGSLSVGDPRLLVEEVFNGTENNDTSSMTDALDSLAEQARVQGHDLMHIVSNLDEMVAALSSLQSAIR